MYLVLNEWPPSMNNITNLGKGVLGFYRNFRTKKHNSTARVGDENCQKNFVTSLMVNP